MRDPRERDWWLYPVTIRTGVNDLFQINETGVGGNGVITITIPAGNYYTHLDTHFDGKYPSLFRVIDALLALETTANGYSFENTTPLLSTQQIGAGIRITDPIIAWQIEWISGSVGREWFGLDHTDDATTVATLAGGIYSIQSAFGCRGRHRTTGLGSIEGVATVKRKNPAITSNWSHNRPSDRRGIVWHQDEDYSCDYVYVLAAHVYPERAQLASYASQAGVYPGDTNNCFAYLWGAMARGLTAICVHDDHLWGGLISYTDCYVDTHQLQKLGDVSMSSAVRVRAVQGEAYDISLDTWVIHGSHEFEFTGG